MRRARLEDQGIDLVTAVIDRVSGTPSTSGQTDSTTASMSHQLQKLVSQADISALQLVAYRPHGTRSVLEVEVVPG